MNKEILKLAIPNIISNISIPLLSTVDTALMGRLSTLHLGAVGIGAMIFNFVYWNFGFLRMGTTGVTAQAFGSKDANLIINTIARALLIAIVLALLVLILQRPIALLSFHLLNISIEQQALVENYFYIRIWAAPATFLLFVFMGWFFGMQNAIYPLILTISINIANILCSFLLVRSYQWGISGVAWGTVIAQYVGLLLAIILFIKKYNGYFQHYSQTAIKNIQAFSSFLRINKDIFIRTVCLTFAFGFFYSQSAKEGTIILAVNIILLQFVNWMSYGIDGFAYASESLVGKYEGAKDTNKLAQAIYLSFMWGWALAILYSLTYYLFDQQLLTIFTNQADLIMASQAFLFWMILYPIISTPCYIWDGIFIGLTASKAMRQTMLWSVLVYLLAFYILAPIYGNNGLWAALLVFMAARGIFQWAWFKRISKKPVY